MSTPEPPGPAGMPWVPVSPLLPDDPPKVGDYTANLTLFLDQDPQGQRTIQVHGNALFVDAHGGGGCSTGNGAGGGVLVRLLFDAADEVQIVLLVVDRAEAEGFGVALDGGERSF